MAQPPKNQKSLFTFFFLVKASQAKFNQVKPSQTLFRNKMFMRHLENPLHALAIGPLCPVPSHPAGVPLRDEGRDAVTYSKGFRKK